MGQQVRFLKNPPAHRRQVFLRGAVAPPGQPFAGRRVALLRPFPQGEQGFGAAQTRAGLGDGQYRLRGQVEACRRSGRLPEGAVAAKIAAQAGQGDKDFGRKGDYAPLAPVAQLGGGGAEVVRNRIIAGVGQGQGVGVGQAGPGGYPVQ